MKKTRIFTLSLCIVFFALFLIFPVFAENGEGPDQNPPPAETTEAYALTMKVSPERSGTVSIKVNGKEHTEGKIKQGASVTLTATAKEGFLFERWEVDEIEGLAQSSLNKKEISFKMPKQDVIFDVIFKENKTKFTVFIETNDSMMGTGNFSHKEFLPGDTVKIDAVPQNGFRFVRWTDANKTLAAVEVTEGWESKNEFSFTMPSKDVYLTVEFDYITYYFTLKTKGKGEVEVSGKEKNSAGKYECTFGEEILLSATPEEDYIFVNWAATNSAELSDFDKTDTALTCPASDFTVTANFASGVRKLTLETSEGGTIHPDVGVMEMGINTILNLIATPSEGYAFSHWECSSEKGDFENEKKAETDFTMPEEDCTVKAVFIKGGYRLTLNSSAGGKIEGEEGVYEMGTKVTLKANPLKGYVFSHWQCKKEGVVSSPKSASTEIVIPGEDVTVTAVFVLKTAAAPGVSKDANSDGSSFPWAILIVIFLLSSVAIALVIIRDRYHLSYRYLIKKWLGKKGKE